MYDLWPNLSGDDIVLDMGLHREPNLESVISAQPDLIVGGYRFRDIYEDLRGIQPATIETSARDGEEQIAELKRQVGILGQVFDREDDAAKLVDALDTAVADAWSRFAHTAFVTDVYSRRVVGWNVASALRSEILPVQALDMPAWGLGGDLTGLAHH